MTSTPGNWSFGSHHCTMISHLWPSVLPCAGQLPPCWFWPGYTGEAYSSWCRTNVLYAVWRTCMPWCLVWIFLRTKPRVLLAFCGHVLDMCIPMKVMADFQFYSLKDLAMQNMLVPNWGTGPGNMQNLAFTRIIYYSTVFVRSVPVKRS